MDRSGSFSGGLLPLPDSPRVLQDSGYGGSGYGDSTRRLGGKDKEDPEVCDNEGAEARKRKSGVEHRSTTSRKEKDRHHHRETSTGRTSETESHIGSADNTKGDRQKQFVSCEELGETRGGAEKRDAAPRAEGQTSRVVARSGAGSAEKAARTTSDTQVQRPPEATLSRTATDTDKRKHLHRSSSKEQGGKAAVPKREVKPENKYTKLLPAPPRDGEGPGKEKHAPARDGSESLPPAANTALGSLDDAGAVGARSSSRRDHDQEERQSRHREDHAPQPTESLSSEGFRRAMMEHKARQMVRSSTDEKVAGEGEVEEVDEQVGFGGIKQGSGGGGKLQGQSVVAGKVRKQTHRNRGEEGHLQKVAPIEEEGPGSCGAGETQPVLPAPSTSGSADGEGGQEPAPVGKKASSSSSASLTTNPGIARREPPRKRSAKSRSEKGRDAPEGPRDGTTESRPEGGVTTSKKAKSTSTSRAGAGTIAGQQRISDRTQQPAAQQATYYTSQHQQRSTFAYPHHPSGYPVMPSEQFVVAEGLSYHPQAPGAPPPSYYMHAAPYSYYPGGGYYAGHHHHPSPSGGMPAHPGTMQYTNLPPQFNHPPPGANHMRPRGAPPMSQHFPPRNPPPHPGGYHHVAAAASMPVANPFVAGTAPQQMRSTASRHTPSEQGLRSVSLTQPAGGAAQALPKMIPPLDYSPEKYPSAVARSSSSSDRPRRRPDSYSRSSASPATDAVKRPRRSATQPATTGGGKQGTNATKKSRNCPAAGRHSERRKGGPPVGDVVKEQVLRDRAERSNYGEDHGKSKLSSRNELRRTREDKEGRNTRSSKMDHGRAGDHGRKEGRSQHMTSTTREPHRYVVDPMMRAATTTFGRTTTTARATTKWPRTGDADHSKSGSRSGRTKGTAGGLVGKKSASEFGPRADADGARGSRLPTFHLKNSRQENTRVLEVEGGHPRETLSRRREAASSSSSGKNKQKSGNTSNEQQLDALARRRFDVLGGPPVAGSATLLFVATFCLGQSLSDGGSAFDVLDPSGVEELFREVGTLYGVFILFGCATVSGCIGHFVIQREFCVLDRDGGGPRGSRVVLGGAGCSFGGCLLRLATLIVLGRGLLSLSEVLVYCVVTDEGATLLAVFQWLCGGFCALLVLKLLLLRRGTRSCASWGRCCKKKDRLRPRRKLHGRNRCEECRRCWRTCAEKACWILSCKAVCGAKKQARASTSTGGRAGTAAESRRQLAIEDAAAPPRGEQKSRKTTRGELRGKRTLASEGQAWSALGSEAVGSGDPGTAIEQEEELLLQEHRSHNLKRRPRETSTARLQPAKLSAQRQARPRNRKPRPVVEFPTFLPCFTRLLLLLAAFSILGFVLLAFVPAAAPEWFWENCFPAEVRFHGIFYGVNDAKYGFWRSDLSTTTPTSAGLQSVRHQQMLSSYQSLPPEADRTSALFRRMDSLTPADVDHAAGAAAWPNAARHLRRRESHRFAQTPRPAVNASVASTYLRETPHDEAAAGEDAAFERLLAAVNAELKTLQLRTPLKSSTNHVCSWSFWSTVLFGQRAELAGGYATLLQHNQFLLLRNLPPWLLSAPEEEALPGGGTGEDAGAEAGGGKQVTISEEKIIYRDEPVFGANLGGGPRKAQAVHVGPIADLDPRLRAAERDDARARQQLARRRRPTPQQAVGGGGGVLGGAGAAASEDGNSVFSNLHAAGGPEQGRAGQGIVTVGEVLRQRRLSQFRVVHEFVVRGAPLIHEERAEQGFRVSEATHAKRRHVTWEAGHAGAVMGASRSYMTNGQTPGDRMRGGKVTPLDSMERVPTGGSMERLPLGDAAVVKEITLVAERTVPAHQQQVGNNQDEGMNNAPGGSATSRAQTTSRALALQQHGNLPAVGNDTGTSAMYSDRPEGLQKSSSTIAASRRRKFVFKCSEVAASVGAGPGLFPQLVRNPLRIARRENSLPLGAQLFRRSRPGSLAGSADSLWLLGRDHGRILSNQQPLLDRNRRSSPALLRESTGRLSSRGESRRTETLVQLVFDGRVLLLQDEEGRVLARGDVTPDGEGVLHTFYHWVRWWNTIEEPDELANVYGVRAENAIEFPCLASSRVLDPLLSSPAAHVDGAEPPGSFFRATVSRIHSGIGFWEVLASFVGNFYPLCYLFLVGILLLPALAQRAVFVVQEAAGNAIMESSVVSARNSAEACGGAGPGAADVVSRRGDKQQHRSSHARPRQRATGRRGGQSCSSSRMQNSATSRGGSPDAESRSDDSSRNNGKGSSEDPRDSTRRGGSSPSSKSVFRNSKRRSAVSATNPPRLTTSTSTSRRAASLCPLSRRKSLPYIVERRLAGSQKFLSRAWWCSQYFLVFVYAALAVQQWQIRDHFIGAEPTFFYDRSVVLLPTITHGDESLVAALGRRGDVNAVVEILPLLTYGPMCLDAWTALVACLVVLTLVLGQGGGSWSVVLALSGSARVGRVGSGARTRTDSAARGIALLGVAAGGSSSATESGKGHRMKTEAGRKTGTGARQAEPPRRLTNSMLRDSPAEDKGSGVLDYVRASSRYQQSQTPLRGESRRLPPAGGGRRRSGHNRSRDNHVNDGNFVSASSGRVDRGLRDLSPTGLPDDRGHSARSCWEKAVSCCCCLSRAPSKAQNKTQDTEGSDHSPSHEDLVVRSVGCCRWWNVCRFFFVFWLFVFVLWAPQVQRAQRVDAAYNRDDEPPPDGAGANPALLDPEEMNDDEDEGNGDLGDRASLDGATSRGGENEQRRLTKRNREPTLTQNLAASLNSMFESVELFPFSSSVQTWSEQGLWSAGLHFEHHRLVLSNLWRYEFLARNYLVWPTRVTLAGGAGDESSGATPASSVHAARARGRTRTSDTYELPPDSDDVAQAPPARVAVTPPAEVAGVASAQQGAAAESGDEGPRQGAVAPLAATASAAAGVPASGNETAAAGLQAGEAPASSTTAAAAPAGMAGAAEQGAADVELEADLERQKQNQGTKELLKSALKLSPTGVSPAGAPAGGLPHGTPKSVAFEDAENSSDGGEVLRSVSQRSNTRLLAGAQTQAAGAANGDPGSHQQQPGGAGTGPNPSCLRVSDASSGVTSGEEDLHTPGGGRPPEQAQHAHQEDQQEDGGTTAADSTHPAAAGAGAISPHSSPYESLPSASSHGLSRENLTRPSVTGTSLVLRVPQQEPVGSDSVSPTAAFVEEMNRSHGESIVGDAAAAPCAGFQLMNYVNCWGRRPQPPLQLPGVPPRQQLAWERLPAPKAKGKATAISGFAYGSRGGRARDEQWQPSFIVRADSTPLRMLQRPRNFGIAGSDPIMRMAASSPLPSSANRENYGREQVLGPSSQPLTMQRQLSLDQQAALAADSGTTPGGAEPVVEVFSADFFLSRLVAAEADDARRMFLAGGTDWLRILVVMQEAVVDVALSLAVQFYRRVGGKMHADQVRSRRVDDEEDGTGSDAIRGQQFSFLARDHTVGSTPVHTFGAPTPEHGWSAHAQRGHEQLPPAAGGGAAPVVPVLRADPVRLPLPLRRGTGACPRAGPGPAAAALSEQSVPEVAPPAHVGAAGAADTTSLAGASASNVSVAPPAGANTAAEDRAITSSTFADHCPTSETSAPGEPLAAASTKAGGGSAPGPLGTSIVASASGESCAPGIASYAPPAQLVPPPTPLPHPPPATTPLSEKSPLPPHTTIPHGASGLSCGTTSSAGGDSSGGPSSGGPQASTQDSPRRNRTRVQQDVDMLSAAGGASLESGGGGPPTGAYASEAEEPTPRGTYTARISSRMSCAAEQVGVPSSSGPRSLTKTPTFAATSRHDLFSTTPQHRPQAAGERQFQFPLQLPPLRGGSRRQQQQHIAPGDNHSRSPGDMSAQSRSSWPRGASLEEGGTATQGLLPADPRAAPREQWQDGPPISGSDEDAGMNNTSSDYTRWARGGHQRHWLDEVYERTAGATRTIPLYISATAMERFVLSVCEFLLLALLLEYAIGKWPTWAVTGVLLLQAAVLLYGGLRKYAPTWFL